MALVRAALGALVVASSLAFALPANAGQLDGCAQRVIRDWYAGGKVDRLYPLGCYRAALRALPEDVRQYSDANREIARALAYARRGLRDRAGGAATATAPSAPASPPTAVRATPPPSRERSASVAAPHPVRGSIRLASASGPVDGAGLPLPLIVLVTLATMLLAAAGAAALAARHRRRTTGPDR